MPRLQLRNFGTSLSFNGGTDVVNYSTLNSIGAWTQLSFAFWMRAPVGSNAVVFGNASSNATTGFAVRTFTDGLLYLYHSSQLKNSKAANTNYWNPGDWHHIVGVINQGVNMSLYIDGQAVGTPQTVASISLQNSTNAIQLGGSRGSSAFSGKMDDVYLWNTILSAADVQSLYYNNIIPQTASLQMHTPLNEGSGTTANDTSGNNNNGTITSATYSTDTPLKPRLVVRDSVTALSFPRGGGSSTVTVKTGTILSTLANYTISAWVKPSLGSLGPTAVYCERAASGNDILKLETDNGTRNYSLVLRDDAGAFNQTSGTQIKDGNWHHILAVRNGGTILLYKDGVLDAQGNSAVSNTYTNAGISSRIGSDAGDGTATFDGNIDEVRLWNVALTTAQVADLYYNNMVPSSGLVGEWLFNEGAGTTAIDTSSGGNNGTITGATYTPDVISRSRRVIQNFTAALFKGDLVSANNATLDISLIGFTVIFDVFLPAFLLGNAIVLFQDGSGNDRIRVHVEGGTNKVYVWTTTSGGSGSLAFKTLVGITLQTWHRIAVIYDGAGATKIFVDGQYLGTGTGNVSGATQAFRALPNNNSGQTLSNIRVWMKQLTNTDIQNDYYNSGPTPSGLTLSWLLNEGSGTTANDSTGNGFTGTITSQTWVNNVSVQSRQLVSPNLVKNGNFEYAPPFTAATATTGNWIDGTAAGSGTNTLFGWYMQSTAGTAGNKAGQFDSTVFHSGLYSIKFSMLNVADAGYLYSNNPNSRQKVLAAPCLPSTSYTLTGWIKTVNAIGSRIFLNECDGNDSYILTNNSTTVVGTQNWTQVILTVTTGSTTRFLEVGLQVQVGAIQDTWFDDITLTPTTPTTRSAA